MGGESFQMMEKFLRDQFEVILFSGNSDSGSQEDAVATADLSKKVGAEWVVVDGYQFDSGYQSLLKASGLRLLWIDDYGHAAPYTADIVLNQNTSADEAMYSKRSLGTRVLLGPQYVLLRREFWRWRDWRRTHRPKVKKVLVMFGGGDSTDIIRNVMNALEDLSEKNEMVFTVVSEFMSAKSPDTNNVEIKSYLRTRYLKSIEDMSPLMAEADLAISAIGSTCWEMAFMGLPAIVYYMALNQEGVAYTLDRMGVVRRAYHNDPFNRGELVEMVRDICNDADLRRRMSEAGRRLVDGRGGFRVVKIMREVAT